jgi:lincosamide nucleotidyltransferase B/F
MPTPQDLLNRLDAIGRSLEKSGHALALIGLGSVGVETDRLDVYSDLDFFAIVENGYKTHYIANLDWLSSLCPIVYHFRNTPDGYKLLYQDGIFCEFAVFELPELQKIPYGRGRIIWKQPQIDETICIPAASGARTGQPDPQWLIGEALTNLYVGLGRLKRGEKLSAERFIQHYAVDRILELANLIEQEADIVKDEFTNERRFEQRFPQLAQELPHFIQGYERSSESARAILEFLERHFKVNQGIASAIRQLSDRRQPH